MGDLLGQDTTDPSLLLNLAWSSFESLKQESLFGQAQHPHALGLPFLTSLQPDLKLQSVERFRMLGTKAGPHEALGAMPVISKILLFSPPRTGNSDSLELLLSLFCLTAPNTAFDFSGFLTSSSSWTFPHFYTSVSWCGLFSVGT